MFYFVLEVQFSVTCKAFTQFYPVCLWQGNKQNCILLSNRKSFKKEINISNRGKGKCLPRLASELFIFHDLCVPWWDSEACWENMGHLLGHLSPELWAVIHQPQQWNIPWLRMEWHVSRNFWFAVLLWQYRFYPSMKWRLRKSKLSLINVASEIAAQRIFSLHIFTQPSRVGILLRN